MLQSRFQEVLQLLQVAQLQKITRSESFNIAKLATIVFPIPSTSLQCWRIHLLLKQFGSYPFKLVSAVLEGRKVQLQKQCGISKTWSSFRKS